MRVIDVTLAVNLHSEGDLCRASLDSAVAAVTCARDAGLRTELMLILDRPDDQTIRAVEMASTDARIEVIDVGDLGEARNHAVGAARSRYLAFLDGDDLCCRLWLVRAVAEAKCGVAHPVVHPALNFFFGRDYDRYFWVHPDMRTQSVTLARLLVENLWTSSLLAETEVFRRFPYRPNRLSSGFGYEDWTWNVETILAGLVHVTAPNTIHFIRRNRPNSLSKSSQALKVIPELFGIEELANMTPERLRRPLGPFVDARRVSP